MMKMSSRSEPEVISFNLDVTDYTLTPLCCASLINEIIKNLLYLKDQIPYPYASLKSIVEKKRLKDTSLTNEQEKSNKINSASKHFQTVSKTYDSLETIMRSISEELQCEEKVEEIVFVFGVTPYCPKEVYTIQISALAHGHSEREHILENNKKQLKLMRDLFLSPSWNCLSDNLLSCTNFYVYMKKLGKAETREDAIFIPTKPISISPKVKHTVIRINYRENCVQSNCCDKVAVFGDLNECDGGGRSDRKNVYYKDNLDIIWSQSKVLVQGFQDCFINKVSASELWKK